MRGSVGVCECTEYGSVLSVGVYGVCIGYGSIWGAGVGVHGVWECMGCGNVVVYGMSKNNFSLQNLTS